MPIPALYDDKIKRNFPSSSCVNSTLLMLQPFIRPIDVSPFQVGDQLSAELVVCARCEFLDPDNCIQCLR